MFALASAVPAQETGPPGHTVWLHREPDPALYSGARTDFLLTGVALRRDASYALIGVSGGPETPYRIGEQLQPGVVLAAISPDRVAIARNGTLEWLPLRRRTSTFHEDPIIAPAPVAVSEENASGAESPPNWILNSGTPGPSPVARKLGAAAARQAKIAARADGGFQVTSVQPGSAFEQMGLRAGDLLSSVNGRPIDSFDGLAWLYQQIEGGGDRPNVQVLRDGRLEDLSRAGDRSSGEPQ
jgi:type II secretory pathway component PulC